MLLDYKLQLKNKKMHKTSKKEQSNNLKHKSIIAFQGVGWNISLFY